MDNFIERYVYDVTRRLPEIDRIEVSKELKSNIYDMLSDNAEETEIQAVLYKLGAPASLAEKYRQKPRYLISPAIYDKYVRVLKWLLPLVGGVLLAIGSAWGAIDAIKDGMADLFHFISNSLSKGISLGVSAVFQALVWTTVGFVIAERTNVKADESKDREWKIEDLPEVLPNDKNRIPLSDSIIELVLTVVFSVVAILACNGILPTIFIIQNGDTQIRTLFSTEFLAACIPAIVAMSILGISECIAKIKARRWTPLVCGAVIVSNLVNMGIMLYLINRPNLLSAEFTAFIESVDLGGFDLLRFIGTGRSNLIIIFISIIIVACSLVGCCMAVYKTLKYKIQ